MHHTYATRGLLGPVGYPQKEQNYIYKKQKTRTITITKQTTKTKTRKSTKEEVTNRSAHTHIHTCITRTQRGLLGPVGDPRLQPNVCDDLSTRL